MISIESELERNQRNKSLSQRLSEKKQSHNTISNPFKIASKIILQGQTLPTKLEKSQQERTEQSSLQQMYSSNVTAKISKISDYVHLPKVKLNTNMDRESTPVSRYKSEEAIYMKNVIHQPSTGNNHSFLMQEQQNSIILQSHQKLSESQNRQDDSSLWNLQKLKMALDFVTLEQSDDQANSIIRPEGKKRQGFKQHRQKQLQKERERVKRQRERNMEMVNGFLSGKATFMWLFILGKTVAQQSIQPVKEIYQTYFDNDYQIPLCHSYEQAKNFLNIQSCFFKIVSDLENAQYLIDESQHNKNIIAIYIYNPEKEKGVSKSFQLKRKSRKVRGMFMDLSDAAQMAEEQIENQAKFIRVGSQLERQRNRLRFPAFFILNGVDNTDITSYRMCLFASLSLSEPKERLVYLQQFTSMVQLRYASNKTQLLNLQQYKKINHIDAPTQEKHNQVISFYAKESFYYALVNAVLRMSRNSQEFRPCVIPFNETYLAIKFYYKKYLKENSSAKVKFTTYRGAKLRNSDVKSLKLGSLIELLGFTSTSLNKEQALKFMDNDSYLIEIIVESTASDQKQAEYDHGFVQLNRYGLAAQGFIDEQEVLFNALNVYQVIELDLDSAVRRITLKYGSIIDLLRAKNALKGIQRSVLQNYRHCISNFKAIEDDGDALLLAHQHDQCVAYYTSKIESGVTNSKHFGKLAGAQLEIGDIDSAYKNALLSLEMIENEKKENGLTASYKVPVSYNSLVFEQTHDFVNYERSTNIYLNLEDRWDEKCNMLMRRAKNKLNNGDYSGCLRDIFVCDKTLREQQQSFHKMRKELKTRYFFLFLCCFCTSFRTQIEERRQLELLKIQEQQIIFLSKKQLYKQLKLKSKIMLSTCKSKIGSDLEYQQALSQAKQIFESLSSQKYDEQAPAQYARYKFLQAQTLDIENQYALFEDLVEEAIDSLKAENPFHPKIAEYCEFLGSQHYEKIQLSLNVPKNESEKNARRRTDRFDYQEHKVIYKKCRLYLQQAADQLSFLKGSSSAKVLAINNQLATLDYEFSLLKQAEDRTKKSVALKGYENSPEGAKCHILLTKIALAKGELKRASIHLQKATSVLNKSLIKFQTPEYNKVLIRHPLNIQICSLRAKVFNRQQKHDLALKQLQLLQRLVKLQNPFSLSLLANLEEEEAEVLVCLGETENFESCILRSVEIREQAMGKYNIPNAISFSNLFKYLRYTNDFENAVKYHQKSTQIFSRFPPDHPNTWVLHLSNGLIFYQKRQFSLALPELEAGLRIAERRYSSNHINFMKIRLQFAKIMRGMGQFDRALRLLQSLEAVVTRNLKQSAKTQKIQSEIDDQKIALRRSVLLQMKEIHERERKTGDSLRTALGLQRIQISLRECEQFISSGQKMDSLKSLT